MGRPINPRFLGKNAPHQIQALVWGTNDTGATAGYLASQNSPRRYRATTVNGTSGTVLANGPANVAAAGTAAVKVFPVGTQPTTYATGNVTLKAFGTPNIVVGGTGYHAGDFLGFLGGSANTFANVQVLTVNAAGAILTTTTPTVTTGFQAYTALPANISAIATTSNGAGVGATLASNFGIDQANVITGGAGYTAAVFVVEGNAEQLIPVPPTFTQPTVTAGVVHVGPVTVTASGVVNFIPTVTIEEETGVTEYVSYMQSMNYLETFQGHRYRWLYKGQPIPSDYASLGVSLAYLDTL